MRKSIKIKIKLVTLIIIAVILLPVIFACGEKNDTPAPANDSATEPVTEAPITAPPDTTPEPTTPEPTTTEEPTTKEPVEIGPIDPNLPYWDQIAVELSYYGFKDGKRNSAGENEVEAMSKFKNQGIKKPEPDISGEDVPFSAMIRCVVEDYGTDNFSTCLKINFSKDVPVQDGDIIIGALWVRGKSHVKEGNPAEFDLVSRIEYANWASMDIAPYATQKATDKWQRIFFSIHVSEENIRGPQLYLYLGMASSGAQELDIGGFVTFIYPPTAENEKAASRLIK